MELPLDWYLKVLANMDIEDFNAWYAERWGE